MTQPPPPPPPIVPKDYSVGRNGVRIGKFKPLDFRQGVASGKIRQDDWFWTEGMNEWKRVSELKILEQLHKSPPPIPAALVSPPIPAAPPSPRLPVTNPSFDQAPLARAELDTVTRGSMVQVADPEEMVWYWVIVERCLEDHCFLGRIDAHCIIAGPTLRPGGKVAFHESNILGIWPIKVNPIFERGWFRVASSICSPLLPMKALKRLERRA